MKICLSSPLSCCWVLQTIQALSLRYGLYGLRNTYMALMLYNVANGWKEYYCTSPHSLSQTTCNLFWAKRKKMLSDQKFEFRKKTKNILAILFMHILHMLNFKKLALIATEIWSEISAEIPETVTEPKTIPPTIFLKWSGVIKYFGVFLWFKYILETLSGTVFMNRYIWVFAQRDV